MTNTRDAADVIHHSTKHGTPALRPLVNFPRLDPHNRPSPFKQYRDLSISPLPRELLTSTPSAVRLLSGERGEPHPLDATLLATLLYLTAGVTRTAMLRTMSSRPVMWLDTATNFLPRMSTDTFRRRSPSEPGWEKGVSWSVS